MAPASSSTLPADVQHPTGLLRVLLDTSLTGIMLLQPCHDAASDTIIDFAWVHLNPAAQRQLSLPERPAPSFLTLFPTADTTGVFGFYRDAFLTGEVVRHQNIYQSDGLDGYFVLVAQRYEGLLVVNFTDTNNQPRTAVEEALRASQAREQAARAEAELQRQQLHEVFEQAPAMICIFDGPQHVFQFVNPPYQALVGERPLVGQPIAQAMPELAGQPIFDLLDQVYQTGEAYHATEMLVQLDHHNEGRPELEKRYYNFIYQARRDGRGVIDGILVFAYDVTPQVQARQQVARLNEELAATNNKLRASNEEYLAANKALGDTQQQVQRLNQELEARVQARTQQFLQQSGRLKRLLQEAPAAICTLDGPELVFEFVNPGYQQLFPNRLLLGKPVLVALPELAGSPVETLLRGVYETGVTFEGNEVQMSFARPGDGLVEDRYFNFIYQARYDAAGRIDGLVVFAFEVTEPVQIRQQVQQLNAALLAANEALHHTNSQLLHTNTDLDTFVYAASHDLKAPIANIEGLLEALREYLPTGAQEPMVPRLVGMMQGAITRFQQTVGHLTDVSRLQDTSAQGVEVLDLARMLDDVRLDLLPLLESTRAELTVDVAAYPRVFFSPKNLRSILYNLVSNAVKYRAPDRAPVVQVRARPAAGPGVVLDVQDNGLGLSEQQQGKLFTMFKRLHTHVEGSGVGLYMLKRLVENAGGTVTVQSQPGIGSTFTVTLPSA